MPNPDFEKKQSWIKKIQDYENSGLSFKAWCEKNNEKIHTFQYWRRKLKEHRVPRIEFEELKDASLSFAIEIHRKELSICLPNGCDQKTLKECLLAIEKALC
jgi:hypothetical protein